MGRFFDFIEIGTSDFDALIQVADARTIGLSIDAVPVYLDRLPSQAGCMKLNAGISDRDGETEVFFVPPPAIRAYGLPDWVRGCSTIGRPHPTVLALLDTMKLPLAIVERVTIPVYRLRTVVRNFDVAGIFVLKIDTEGHDTVILQDFFRRCPAHLYPHHLYFETNRLSDNDKVHELIAGLITTGYDIVRSATGGEATDTHLRLNLHRLGSRTRFSEPIPGYYLLGYPDRYDPLHPPHANTLQDAQEFCRDALRGGVTFQYGRYEVREGRYLMAEKGTAELTSWLLTA